LTYRVLLHPKADRYLNKVDLHLRRRIRDSLRELEEFPLERGERLKYSSFWRLRVGDHRVIYEVNDEKREVIVLFIGHRSDVYDDFSRLL